MKAILTVPLVSQLAHYFSSSPTCSGIKGLNCHLITFISSSSLDEKLTQLSLVPYLVLSRVVTCTFFIFYMLMWRSWYNLGYLQLTDDLRILAAFFMSTIALMLLDCYSTVIGEWQLQMWRSLFH